MVGASKLCSGQPADETATQSALRAAMHSAHAGSCAAVSGHAQRAVLAALCTVALPSIRQMHADKRLCFRKDLQSAGQVGPCPDLLHAESLGIWVLGSLLLTKSLLWCCSAHNAPMSFRQSSLVASNITCAPMAVLCAKLLCTCLTLPCALP